MFQNVVTNKLEGGDRQKAMKRLRVPPLGEQVRACVRARALTSTLITYS